MQLIRALSNCWQQGTPFISHFNRSTFKKLYEINFDRWNYSHSTLTHSTKQEYYITVNQNHFHYISLFGPEKRANTVERRGSGETVNPDFLNVYKKLWCNFLFSVPAKGGYDISLGRTAEQWGSSQEAEARRGVVPPPLLSTCPFLCSLTTMLEGGGGVLLRASDQRPLLDHPPPWTIHASTDTFTPPGVL